MGIFFKSHKRRGLLSARQLKSNGQMPQFVGITKRQISLTHDIFSIAVG